MKNPNRTNLYLTIALLLSAAAWLTGCKATGPTGEPISPLQQGCNTANGIITRGEILRNAMAANPKTQLVAVKIEALLVKARPFASAICLAASSTEPGNQSVNFNAIIALAREALVLIPDDETRTWAQLAFDLAINELRESGLLEPPPQIQPVPVS